VEPLVYDVTALEVSLGARHVLGPLELQVGRGSFVGVVGPNGSGKTTLLRALTGALRPAAGDIRLAGKPLGRYHPLESARVIGVVPQSFNLDFNFTVEEIVAMGRYAHGGHGAAAVAAALEATGVTALADRPVTELSGGERQRALIAQTLAQETPVLLLDEPLNNLDLNHQLEIMELLRTLHAAGRTIIVVLHDLNMASQYCDELLLLGQGHVIARGTPSEILDPGLILEVFKTRVAVHRQGRRPYMTPVWTQPPSSRPDPNETRVHVIAGGGAATGLIEELVMRGITPSVGVVSVFDTDYATAQAYELEVVSSPPFEPFPPEALEEFDALAERADALVVAPIFFGRGNLAPLRSALRAAKAGTKVIVVDHPPLGERDLSGGEATALMRELVALGATEVADSTQAANLIAAP
jgi:iron complex transport system ATP-binding protein